MQLLRRWWRTLLGGREVAAEPSGTGMPPLAPRHPARRPARASPAWRDPFPEAAASNFFALGLYARLCGVRSNLVCSPFSIRSVLAMALVGARGETEAQLRRVLDAADDNETLQAGHAAARRWFTATSETDCQLSSAVSLWCQSGEPLLPEFRECLERHHGGAFEALDFRADAEAGRRRINAWAAERTRGQIRELLTPGSVRADTRLVLVDTIDFRAAWSFPFRELDTHEGVFRVAPDRHVTAAFLSQQSDHRYARGPGYQAVELSYRGGHLSLLVLLPDADDGLAALERELDAEWLARCTNSLELTKIRVELPRFAFGSRRELSDDLMALGAGDLFDRARADLSGVNGLRPPDENALFVSGVIHAARIEVTESGTAAAAATAVVETTIVGIPRELPRTPHVRADHPFLFLICDSTSGVVLFLGRVVDPTEN